MIKSKLVKNFKGINNEEIFKEISRSIISDEMKVGCKVQKDLFDDGIQTIEEVTKNCKFIANNLATQLSIISLEVIPDIDHEKLLEWLIDESIKHSSPKWGK